MRFQMFLRNCLLAIAILLTPLESLAQALPPAGPDQTDRHSLNAAVLDQKPQPTGTADEVQAKVDKLFVAWDKPDTPGAALAVVRDGTVIYKRGYGIANLEYDIPITPATIFHVASVSKQFTAFAITLLALQGKLSFDEDIRKYLPEVPDFGKTITINHLLHHTSGLRDQWELLAMAGWRLDDVITREHILKMVRHEKELNFDPGQEMLYCNTGFTLLALIVERVSGQSFRQYTQENIFKPLGMTNSHFHDDHEMIVKNRAYSYSVSKAGGLKLSALNYANVGATSLFTTVEDLAKWIHNFDDAKVGGRAAIDQMLQVGVLNNGTKTNYAFGLVVGERKGLKMVSHSGGDAAYSSHVVWFPDQKFGVVVLSNFGSVNPSRLAEAVADIYLEDKEAAAASKDAASPAPMHIDPARLDAYIGKYVLDGGPVVDFVRDNGKLIALFPGGARAEAIPESTLKFRIKAFEIGVTFGGLEKGRFTEATLEPRGQSLHGKRAEPPELTPAQLADYAGNYYSDELGTTYTLVVQDGKLVAQHRRHDDITLTPLDPDTFLGSQWFFQRVRFTRDKDGRVSGMRVTGGRVRNMRFDRHP